MPYDPNEMIGLEQQRKLAESLRKQSQQPIEGQMVSGHYVGPSITEGMANMLRAYKSKSLSTAADTKEKEIKDAKRAEQARLLKGIGMSDEQAAMYGNEPAIGMAAWQQQNKRQDTVSAAQAAEEARIRNLQGQEDMRKNVELYKQGLQASPDGQQTFIPGSQGEEKFKKQIAADYETTLKARDDARRVLANASKLIGLKEGDPDHPGLEAATGASYYSTKLMPAWTDAAKAETRIKEIKEQMQAVGKNMMPGLGSMAVQEWPKVEALISQIDPTADTEIVKEKIRNAVLAFDNFTKIAEKKYMGQYGSRLDQFPQFKLDSGEEAQASSLPSQDAIQAEIARRRGR